MITNVLAKLSEGQTLSVGEAAAVMDLLMTGAATPAQVGALLMALRVRGETVDEMTGFAQTMRAKAVRVPVEGLVVDTCGTGGDHAGTFNISTTAAFVVAGAGVRVAKHGNRAATSRCGSADVLEALGVAMDLGPEQVATCIREASIGFMFAPAFHPAMKHVMPVRRELGVRTVFNLLGPLTNPAGAQAQLLGVADPLAQEKMAHVLAALGTRHALVVRGTDGVDELTLGGPTAVYEVRDGGVRSYTLTPEELGLPSAPVSALRGGTAEENAAIVRAVLSGERGPRRDVVLLNAAAALVAADAAPTMRDGLALAAEAIDTGRAAAALERLVAVSQRLRGAAA